MANFPVGSCVEASIFLGTYFKENGINGFMLVKGDHEDDLLENHYWLEKGSMLVDITADQFDGIQDKILVGNVNSTFHRTFNKEIIREADYHLEKAHDVKRHYDAVYKYIIENK